MFSLNRAAFNPAATPTPLPTYLIINLPDFSRYMLRFEEETSLDLNQEFIQKIAECVTQEATAKEQLEYYCLSLAEEYCAGVIYAEFDALMKLICVIGQHLTQQLQEHRIYINGIFPYEYLKTRGDALVFMRRDRFLAQLQAELNGG